MSTILSIGTAVPQYGAKQSTILEFMRRAYDDNTAGRKLNILFAQSGIQMRYSTLPDFGQPASEAQLFNGKEAVPDVIKRTDLFKHNAPLLAQKAIEAAFAKLKTNITDFGITHLITVTCTGIYAPGLGAQLIEQMNLPEDISHHAINFMGCNAAFPALNMADMIVKTNENAKVLIVCVELCTLHFQAVDNNSNLLANTIFADGAAAVIVTSDKEAKKYSSSTLTLNGFQSLLLYRGRNLMGWDITPVNFEMVLDPGIPDFIGSELIEILQKATKNMNTDVKNIDRWAVHPGGRKILDAVKKQGQLDENALDFSYKVLSDYGNMSSPTILFVLNEMMQAEHAPGETIMAIGFGPGMSIESALLSFTSSE